MARFGHFPLGEKTFAYFDEASLVLYDQNAQENTRPVRRYADALDLNRRRTPVMITSSSIYQIASDAVEFRFIGSGGTFIQFSADHELGVRFIDRASSPLFNSMFNGIYQFLTPLRINGFLWLIQDADERPNQQEMDARLRRIPFATTGGSTGNGNFIIEEVARGVSNKLESYLVNPSTPAEQQNFLSDRSVSQIRVSASSVERIAATLPFDDNNTPSELPPFRFPT